MTDLQHSGDRRAFVRDLALGALGAASLAAALPEVLSAETNGAAAPAWDLSWTDRLKGKHRAVFDSADLADGFAFFNAVTFMNQYRDVYGASDADAQAVVVMRGKGFYMALNDAMWAKYGLGQELKLAGAPAANPHARSIAGLLGRGATMLACNVAAPYFAGEAAKKAGVAADVVHAEWLANLLPGVVIMPSGVFSLIRAQEAGCSMVKSA
ncbi:MAG: hypothetical protein JWO05_749 [Gemmatimonadetes bacterium]|nr:hypothetical protein [Gemmatimonadota bacterium]